MLFSDRRTKRSKTSKGDVTAIVRWTMFTCMISLGLPLTSDQLTTWVNDMLYLVGFAAVLGILGYLAAQRALRPE